MTDFEIFGLCRQLSAGRQNERSIVREPSSNRCGIIRPRTLSLALVLTLLVGAISPISAADTAGWVENWSLPQFSKEGFRTTTARGTRARADPRQHQIEVIDLNLTIFTGDAVPQVETILLSPAATFLPNQKIARGDQSVRFMSYDPLRGGEVKIQASGTRWLYRHEEKKISLDGDVRVVFSAELKNILQ
jgi:hypothetical protein